MDNAEQPIQFQAPTLEELAPLFPSYELEAFVAQGGMGAVYKARQVSLDRPVAIKILPREFGQDETFRASFEAEAKAMARLNHPNLIGVYDFGNADGMLFLVMEYVEGKSLYHSSYGKAIDPAQAAEIVGAICRALDHAHAAGILHRDIKPANILLAPDATPKIGDFGLARPMNETTDPEEIIYGTPGYTAPEVIHRQPVDHRSDIFSIGVMLHELLTGALPDDHKTPPSRIAQTPLAYDPIIARSTQADPTLRYDSAGEFADALDKAAQSAPQARTLLNVGPGSSGGVAAPVARPHTAIAPQKKSPAAAITLVLLLAIVAVAAIFIANQGSDDGDNTATTPPEKETPPAPTPPAPAPVKEPVTTTSKIIPTPAAKKPAETAWQGLAKLKSALASGKRDKFPTQARAHNGSHFLLIKKTFTWHQAVKFASEHGAHLAILPTTKDRQWAAQNLHLKSPAHIGAGLAARDQWQWLDASPWGDTKKPNPLSPKERTLTLSAAGTLSAADPATEAPILLQWRDDSSNPATMEAQLKRTADSVKANGVSTATYPVGTRSYQQSHFLLLNEKQSWDSARQMAKSYQAELPVPTSPTEQQWLCKTFPNNSPSFWLGGYKLNDKSPWQWITREAWHPTGWAPGEPSDDNVKNRMMMHITSASETKNWTASDGAKGDTTHTLLEWNKPKITKISTAKFDLDKWLNNVNRKIADRVRPLIEDYEKDRAKEISDYVRDMKRAAKKFQIPGRGGRGGRGGGMIERLQNMVEDAMDDVEDSGELPEDIPDQAPQVFKDLTTEAKEKVEKIDKKHEEALQKELDFYTNGLLKKATDIAKDGFTQQANELQETVKEIGKDTTKFTEALGL
ncbi:MAG: protein kinase domain-containing protein [Akkermansiaceae bacterium]